MRKESMKVREVLMGLIDRPATLDRLSIDPEHIRELAASIAEVGLISPILLSPRDDRFEIVAGDCRYQAFLSLGRGVIPALVQELDAENISILRATENLQRKDLSLIEEARTYRRLHEDHNMSWDKIAARVGKSPGLIKRKYDLLKMPEVLINAVHERKIGFVVAEELCRLNNIGKIEYYLDFCVDHGATVQIVKDWVKEELSKERQEKSNIAEGGWGTALSEVKPIYVTCDCCKGPMVLEEVISLRICKVCGDTIKANM